MIGKFLVKLFLNTREQEELLLLHDTLFAMEVETEDQHTQRSIWCGIISSLIFGKADDPDGERILYPLRIDGTEKEIK